MNSNLKIYFIGFFLAIPIMFSLVSILWKTFVSGNPFSTTLIDNLGILGVYYFIISIGFTIYLKKL
ncbi:hypothetical protein MACH08_14660 [Oceanobacillus kimchii]|uniref:Uncharacterized protein n=1 Tax=Oceanobacillus kimchii TaxID=746691 RepID=A0ABQ5TMA7_9BACI|nr:hypothetical protein MACH08_14660 [Oceanobacillus kimchii]